MKKILALAATVAISAFGAQASTFDFTQGASENRMPQLIAEATGVTVGDGDVTVDYAVGANLMVGDDFSGTSQFSDGVALAGGTYNSYLIHFDPTNNTSRRMKEMTFTFAENIVGIILSNGAGTGNNADGVTDQLLNLSDRIFGLAGASYEQTISRRSENSDDMTLLTANSLFVNLATNNGYIDNIRVLTAAPSVVPVPASLPLLLVGLGGIAALRRRKS